MKKKRKKKKKDSLKIFFISYQNFGREEKKIKWLIMWKEKYV